MAALILFVGLGVIIVAAVAARIQERPSFDQRRTGRRRVDHPTARRAVAALAEGGAVSSARAPLSPTSKIGQIVLGHMARVQAQSMVARSKSGPNQDRGKPPKGA